jgi:hypothetical protein
VAQLIKLLDLISRYEINMYRYPSQYIRLKKQHWNKLKHLWELGELEDTLQKNQNELTKEKKSFFSPLKSMLKRKDDLAINNQEEVEELDEIKEDESEFPLQYQFLGLPLTEDELKRRFLDRLFEFQLGWASSTLKEKSFIEKDMFNEENLKYFIQRFPDNYLVLYRPIFIIQKAPVELEVIMISPTETWCITILEGRENSVFVGSKERFWIEKYLDEEKKALNPLLSLSRMEKIVSQIYTKNDVELPIKKVILNRRGFIDYSYAPVDTQIVDKRNYETWFSNLRKLSSPLKHVQLKAAQVLLQHCQTTYIQRPEWENEM